MFNMFKAFTFIFNVSVSNVLCFIVKTLENKYA